VPTLRAKRKSLIVFRAKGVCHMRTGIIPFEEYLCVKNMAPRSVKGHVHNVGKFLKWLSEKSIAIKDVVNGDIINYHEYLKSMNLSQWSIHAYMHSVKRYFEYLDQSGIIFLNPMEGVVLKRSPKQLPRYVSKTEMIRLIETPDTRTPQGIRDRAMLEVMYATGIRLSELYGMEINDVYFEEEMIHVRNGKYQKERVIPVTAVACRWIRTYLTNVRPSFCRKAEEQSLWLGERGRRMHKLLIQRMVREYGRQAGILQTVTPHMIRHSFAKHMLDENVNICFIQQLLGHEHVTVTQRYTHVSKVDMLKEHKKHPRENDEG
jgi:integrase/recombinase XerD